MSASPQSLASVVQPMTEDEAKEYHINPFDLTKVWYHGDFPLLDVGILELNRNPENFFAETEQAAFNPMNIIDGIGFSPDKMLQGRLFSYGDAELFIKQRHIRNCHRADPTYGEGVAKALGLSLSEALTAADPAHPKWDWR